MAQYGFKSLLAAALMAGVMLGVSALPTLAQGTAPESSGEAALRQPMKTNASTPSPERIRRDKWIAYRLTKYVWLDKAAAADPRILAAICEHPGPAKKLAQHRHLAALADADHYLCRRLTRWQGATEKLIRNKECDHVIALDPEGIYFAMDRNPSVARLLARDPQFCEMIDQNPDLGRAISQHMK